MILIVFNQYNILYSLIVGILQKNFPIKLVIYNDVSVLSKYKRDFKNLEILVYSHEEELNNIYNNQLVLGHSLLLKNDESISISNICAYDIYVKIVDESNKIVSVETNQFKKRVQIKEDLIIDIMIECFKNGHPNIGFSYEDKYYILRGKEDTLKDLPVLRLAPYITPPKNEVENNLTKFEENKLNIVPLCNWTTPQNFIQHLNKFKPANTNIHFTLSNKSPIAMVVNETQLKTKASNTIYFMMEPNGDKLYENYLSQYDNNSNRLFYKGSHKSHLNLQEYWLNKSVPELLLSLEENISELLRIKTKVKVLSVCISDRYVDPGHKYRIDLIRKLDEGCSQNKYSFKLDIYGKCQSLKFKNYRGECPEKDKSKSLEEYRYHFTAENHQLDNYVTEKFYDALMSENYLFYYGAPNIEEHYKGCYTKLTGNIDKDIATIEREINEDVWSKSIETIRKEKKKALIMHNLFYRLESILSLHDTFFIKLTKSLNPEQIDMDRYLDDGWGMITACMINPISNWINYLDMILKNMAQYDVGLFLSWNDNYGSYDKLCDELSFLRFTKNKSMLNSKDSDYFYIVQYEGNSEILFENSLFIPLQTRNLLLLRLSQNVTDLKELTKDIEIIKRN
jgi:hypothetical protein